MSRTHLPHLRVLVTAALILGLACGGGGLGAGPAEPVVLVTPALDISGLQRPQTGEIMALMRDLARSPLWHVGRSREGGLVASLRSVDGGPFSNGGSWLGAWVAAGSPAPDPESPTILSNGTLSLPTGGYISVEVLSALPSDATEIGWGALAAGPTAVSLPVKTSYGDKLDGNAWSRVAVPLAGGGWLAVREQGPSPDRSATVEALRAGLSELARIAALPADYKARDAYAEIWAALGGPTQHPLRYPGLQDRDGLGQIFEVQAGYQYDDVTVHVFDEKVCHGECTVDWRQDAKAELLGNPPIGDLALSLVDDCSIALDNKNSEKYGTFSGSKSFEAEIRWVDGKGKTILSTRGDFRGWER